MSVDELCFREIGLAAQLSTEDRSFAMDLVCAHDESSSPENMESRFRRLGEAAGLTWPE